MTFNFDGREYRICFRYDWAEEDDTKLALDPAEKRRQCTWCEIYALPYAKGDEPFARGLVCRHYKDRNCKETARKAALTRALKDAPRTREHNPDWMIPDPKKWFNRAAWEAYLGRKERVVD